MGASVWLLAWALEDALATAGLRYLALLGLVCASLVVFFGTAQAVGGLRLADFRRAIRRS